MLDAESQPAMTPAPPRRTWPRPPRWLVRRLSWWAWLLAIFGGAYLPRSIAWLCLWLLAAMLALAAYGARWRHATARRVLTALPLVAVALPILFVVLLPVRVTSHTDGGPVSSAHAVPACVSAYVTGVVGALVGSDTHLNVSLCTDGRTVRQDWGPDCYGNTALAVVDAHPVVRHASGGEVTVACRLEVSPATLPFVHRTVAMEVTMQPDGRVVVLR